MKSILGGYRKAFSWIDEAQEVSGGIEEFENLSTLQNVHGKLAPLQKHTWKTRKEKYLYRIFLQNSVQHRYFMETIDSEQLNLSI